MSGNSKHPLALRICHMIINANFRICLSWIPSHIGLLGNEKADLWAKRSLTYRQVNRCPISPDTFKRLFDKSLLQHWKKHWDALIIPNTNKFRLNIKKMETESRPNRREEIAICRLRSDATMITHMLPYIHNDFPHICEECNELETVPHILIDCIKYIRERRNMQAYFDSINTRMTAFRLLQDDPEIIRILLNYLKNTDLISHI